MNLLLSAALLSLTAPAAPMFQEELIFPPEKMHNHSSSIVETPDGHLLAAWFHGRGEKSDDTLVIQGARKMKGSDAWSPRFVMADNPGLPDQNSTIYIDPDGKLYLWWISALANTRETYFLQYRTSADYEGTGAPTWDWNGFILEQPQNLVGAMETMAKSVDGKFGAAFDSEEKYRSRLEHGVRMAQFDATYMAEWKDPAIGRLSGMLSWMPRCQPIMLADGRLALGLYSDVYLTSLTCFTSDGGATWEYGEPMRDYGLIQPALIQKEDGTLVAYGRDKSPNKKIRVAESKDAGATWGHYHDLDISNPDSSVAIVKLANGHWVLVCNDLTGKDGRHGRSRLVAYLSDDEGANWKWSRKIEDSTTAPAYKPHASYPTVIQTGDGMIHVTYTFTPESGETIKHTWFNEEWIRAVVQ